MSRLFIGTREQAFVNDVTKEFVKDVVGQFIIYYPISILLTQVHEVYDEAVEKVFENPFKLDVLAGQPDRENTYNQFGLDSETSLELFVQARDLIDKDLEVSIGDFFVYGNEVFEITDALDIENIFGQVEYEKAIKITGKLSRSGEFDIEDFRNMLEQSKAYYDSNVQKTFVQQRGLEENEEGHTNDTRQIRERLGDGMADIALGEGPRKVADDETVEETPIDDATPPDGNGFYNE